MSELDKLRGELAAAKSLLAQREEENYRLREVLRDSNAVCACGCPVDAHENYGEDGECCESDEHECVRTSIAVAGMLDALRRPPQHETLLRMKTCGCGDIRPEGEFCHICGKCQMGCCMCSENHKQARIDLAACERKLASAENAARYWEGKAKG